MFPIQICEWRARAVRNVSAFLAAALFLGAGASVTALAQTHRVSGQVVSSGESVIGASVLVKGTTAGTVTDVDGLFSLQARAQDVLVVSAIGYETKEVPVDGRTSLVIELPEANLLLDDGVVVGYGVQK